jgi:spore germination cell wall hydrolase CwlJ-like protein|tara:strand:- start:936 stop:1412 length:477 start_codon:yes stop_codon:yes gene_type:complete
MNGYSYIVITILCGVYSSTAQTLTHEQNIIAQTLLGEARGEGKAGMYAVACIVKRRVQLKSYPNTPAKVCLEPSQFDYWTQRKRVKWDDQNRANVRRLMQTDTELVRYAKMLAININRVDLNYIKNADHYCTLKTHNYWTKGRKPVATIGQHKFYKLK